MSDNISQMTNKKLMEELSSCEQTLESAQKTMFMNLISEEDSQGNYQVDANWQASDEDIERFIEVLLEVLKHDSDNVLELFNEYKNLNYISLSKDAKKSISDSFKNAKFFALVSRVALSESNIDLAWFALSKSESYWGVYCGLSALINTPTESKARKAAQKRSYDNESFRDRLRLLIKLKKPEKGWNDYYQVVNELAPFLLEFTKEDDILSNLELRHIKNKISDLLSEDHRILRVFQESLAN